MELLYDHFPIVISNKCRNEEFVWPPYSPDLNPCDAFLWGYMKCLVFKTRVPDRVVLKERVATALNGIPLDMIGRSCRRFDKCVTACVQAEGGHFFKY